MDYETVKELFGKGDGDASVMALSTAARDASFGWRELLDVLETTFRHYHRPNDRVEIKWGSFVRNFGGTPPTLYHSDYVFRNLYRMMFMSDFWDDAIMTPEFIEGLAALAERAKSGNSSLDQFRRKYWNKDAMDLTEKLLEFKDKLAEKVMLASGI